MTKRESEDNHSIVWQQFKTGDRQAFNDLLQRYYPLMLNYGVRLIKTKAFVEDILQDFFTDLWQKREGLGDVKNVNAYLLLSFRRRLFREKEKNSRLGLSVELTEDYNFDIEFDVETQWIADERVTENTEKLKYHLDNLTKRQKEAIYLRFYQELDYAEIADLMAINSHSAVNLVYDALKIMRQNWLKLLFFCFSTFF